MGLDRSFPPSTQVPRPHRDHRPTLNGILRVLRSGARWQDILGKYGSDFTCYQALQEWQPPI